MKHLRAILALPFMATVVIPAIILYATETIHIAPPLFFVQFIFAALLVGGGLVLFYKTVSLFATFGEGTLAPWDPTHKLVVRGIYRYVRNPMISGALCILLGEAILMASLALFYWFIIFFLMNAIYIPLSEEPGLEQRFGNDYIEYKKNVPRWIPRRTSWSQEK